MDPFNIKLDSGENAVTLTILPTDFGYYKVIYFGGILGAISQTGKGKWHLIPDEEVEASDLPPYHHDLDSGEVEVVLDRETIQSIGMAIEEGSSTN